MNGKAIALHASLATLIFLVSSPTLANGYIRICNEVSPKQDIDVAVAEPSFTWSGWRVSRVFGWQQIKSGKCDWVYETGYASDTAYIYIQGHKSGEWSSTPRSGTYRAAAPSTAYWCVNNQGADKWPDPTQHKMSEPLTCPKGSRMVSAGSATASARHGDEYTITLK
jgi:hypothetical protein